MLCLVNGQRILLTQQTRILFEVECLSRASPVIVSKCGAVYTP